MKDTILQVGCYGVTTLVVNDAEIIISLKCLTQSGTALYPQALKVGGIVPHTPPGDAAYVR